MAGGSLLKSKDAKNDPPEIFNRRLLFLLLTIAWAGLFYGFDQGNIGGIMELPSFRRDFELIDVPQAQIDNRKGNIAAMFAAGGAVGALLAAPASDYLGRKWSIFLYLWTFCIGGVMQMFPNYPLMLGGRFVGGLGVGACSMLAPQFLSENAPKSVRGSMVCSYNLCIILALMLAFWINYAVSLWPHDRSSQWQTSIAIPFAPAFFMIIQVPFLLETPRYLIRIGKRELGLANLCKLRNLPADHPYIQIEYQESINQIEAEQELHAGNSYWQVLKDVFTIPRNFKRFFLAVMLFLFHKLTGTDSLNYFAPRIFQMIGVGDGDSLLTTGVYGVVKFVTVIFYVGYLVENVGRRLPLIVGSIIQASCLLYLAIYIKFAGENATNDGGSPPAGGIVGAVAIYLYAFGWSFGHSVACYVVAAEIFPARIRSFGKFYNRYSVNRFRHLLTISQYVLPLQIPGPVTMLCCCEKIARRNHFLGISRGPIAILCLSFCLFTNWIVNFGITRATPNLISEIGWGIFLLFSMLTYFGTGFIYLCLPETKGRSIESMDDLFEKPLWMMWKYAYPKEEDKVRQDVQQTVYDTKDVDDDEGFDKSPEVRTKENVRGP